MSPTTVSFVLNGQDRGISAETASRVFEIAARLGYCPRTTSGSPWTRVAYLVDDLKTFSFYTTFFSGVFSHLQRLAPSSMIEPFIIEFNPGNKIAPAKLNELSAHSGFTVFLTSSLGTANFLKKHGKKVILVQSGGTAEGMLSVHCDDIEAGRLAAAFALDMGHKTAGTLFPTGSTAKSPRFLGFSEKFITEGGRIPENFRWEASFDHESATSIVAALAKKSSKLPSFFYCFADNLMFPMIRGLKDIGVNVPEDVSIMGTDNLYWGKFTCPAFTTVDLNEELFASKIIEAINHIKSDGKPYSLAVPVKLIVRETVSDLK
ncbi:MAG: LacI family DNA-binding transcriptional regulator [Victivallales bacterium]|nr:LacI family DNA-binding transcriptional regulator [Victivallales bacterium]